MQPVIAATQGRLPVFVRMLWGATPTLRALPANLRPQRARVDGDDWYVPAEPPADVRERLDLATLAHAAAHRRFGLAPMPRGGLHPVQQILVGLLEDARVERLAMEDLPGLRSLWTPFHDTYITLTPTLEVLFVRLARALFDPSVRDPHPWVVKGQRLFFAGRNDEGDWRSPSPATLRRIASILGNDLGQLRLRLNAGVFEIQPAYRDDNAHLWTTPPEEDGMPLPQSARSTDRDPDDTPPPVGAASRPDVPPGKADTRPVNEGAAASGDIGGQVVRELATREWDYRTRRYRDAWCTVQVQTPVAVAGDFTSGEAVRLADRLLARRVLAPMHRLPERRRSVRGPIFDLPAVVEARAAQRRREPVDPRLYRERAARSRSEVVAIVLDVSNSTANVLPGGGTQTVLDSMRRLAFALAEGVLRAGGRCAVLAFASNTRAQVRFQRLRDFTDPPAAGPLQGQLARLSPGWSTRMGAAVRGVAALLAQEVAAGGRRVILLTDGQPHDVDSHDPRYLREDFRRARKEVAQMGIEVIAIDPAALGR